MDESSRRPTALPISPPLDDRMNLRPDPAIVNALVRKVWNPYHGFGTLIGTIGHPPVFAHVAHYPSRRPEYQITPQHTGAFFVLN